LAGVLVFAIIAGGELAFFVAAIIALVTITTLFVGARL
jgi:hypothetical protein